jgi:hypothetical protein
MRGKQMTGNFQVSSKLNDGRIFVVASETYAGFCEALEQAVGIEESQELLKVMAQSLSGAPQSASQAVENIRSAYPNAQVDHTAHPTQTVGNTLAPEAKRCSHGIMTKRQGQGAKGPWKGYMCPSPKGTPDQCEPVFIRRNDPEWNNF